MERLVNTAQTEFKADSKQVFTIEQPALRWPGKAGFSSWGGAQLGWMGPLDGMVIEMECSRSKTAAIEIDDPRCSGLMVGVAIVMEDLRCTSLVEGLTLEVDDARCGRTQVKMEDPRCQGLHAIW